MKPHSLRLIDPACLVSSIWRRPCRWLLYILFLYGGPAAMTATAADNAVWSVEYLNSRKAEWDQLLGAPIKVEGRISVNGKGNLRLAKCEASFVVADSSNRSLSGKAAVEISGRFKKDKDNGRLYFDVDQIDVISSDIDKYDSRSARLAKAGPEEWYALGDWASDRSRFYEDTELGKKAQAAYERGVSVAWRGLANDDFKGRFELAGKITRFKLPDEKRMELMHEGYRMKWTAAIKAKLNDAEAWKQFASEMANDLPGCTQAVAKLPKEMKEKYENDPLVVYRTAPDEIRRQLHRMFYVTVILKPILNEAEQDGRNGDVIADRIEQIAPEATVLADQYRSLKLTWRLERASTATRAEIEQLANEFRSRRQPDLARQAILVWLQAREPRLREDGALGLLQLADDCLKLLHDEAKAVRILEEAYKLDPNFKDVPQKLNSLGYYLNGVTWMKGIPQQPESPTTPINDQSPGGITIGMTASHLAQVMGGRAGSITRISTKQGFTEVWCYQPRGTSRIIVRLKRDKLATEAMVMDYRSEK